MNTQQADDLIAEARRLLYEAGLSRPVNEHELYEILSRDKWDHEEAAFFAACPRLVAALVERVSRQQQEHYNAEAEWAKFLALTPDAANLPPHEQAMAFLRVWANGYLLKGNYWDVPNTMGMALNHAIRRLETALVEIVTRQPREVELLRAIRADASAYQWHAAIDKLADGGSLGWTSEEQARPQLPDDDVRGMSIDMLDVDRLREWARLLLVHGADITHWGSVPHVAGKMQTLATNIEKAVRDIGSLRAAASRPHQQEEKP